MNKTASYALAILGISILVGTIIYQANSDSTAIFMIPLGLIFTFLGALSLSKKSQDRKQK